MTLISSINEIIEDPTFPEGINWKPRTFQANETIVQEGEEGRTIFLVKSGTLEVTARVELENGQQIKSGIFNLSTGDLFGELCLFERTPRSASVIAVTDGELIEINAEQLSRYLDSNPETGYLVLKALFGTIITRLQKANQRFENLFSWGLKAHGFNNYL